MGFELTPTELDIRWPSEEERRTKERQLNTYSTGAIKAAVQLEQVFIKYPAFENALHAMDRAYQLSRELRQPRGVMIIGPTGSGKTSLLRYFMDSLPRDSLIADPFAVLTIRLQDSPSVGRLVSALLRRLQYPFPSVKGDSLGAKRDILIESLKNRGTRIILVDEASAMCDSSTRRTHFASSGNDVTEFWRELIDDAQLSVVLAGTEDLNKLSKVDSALFARVPVVETLKDLSCDLTWQAMLHGFARSVTRIKLDVLLSPNADKLLHLATYGNFRRLKLLLSEATLISIDRDTTSVTMQDLELAFDRAFGSSSLTPNPFRGQAKKGKRDAAA